MKQKQLDEVKGIIRVVESLLEIALLLNSYFFMWNTIQGEYSSASQSERSLYLLIVVYAVLIVSFLFLCDGFKFGYLKLYDLVASQLISVFIVDIVTYFQLCLMVNRLIAIGFLGGLLCVDIIICIGCCIIFHMLYHRIYVSKQMIMIYGTEKALDLKFKMDTRLDKYHVVKMICANEESDVIKREILKYDAVILNDIPAQTRNDIMKYCYSLGKSIYIVPKISDEIMRGAQDIILFDTPLLLVKSAGLTWMEQFIKRGVDIILCLIAMVPAAPIMLLVSIAIKLEDKGTVFYKQERVTKDGKKFNILKFRSMIVNAEKEGKPVPAVENDPRITKVGHIIRATRIDELPQLLNILMGQMSIVGPRPERTEHVEIYTREIPEFSYRLKVKGGLTGYAQVYGKYNTSAYNKLLLDLKYIENYSLLLDIKLILMTLRVLFKKESTEGFNKAADLSIRREIFQDSNNSKEN